MIFDIMSQFKTNHEKNVYFQELVEKKLINDDVYNQLKELSKLPPKRIKDIIARRSKP